MSSIERGHPTERDPHAVTADILDRFERPSPLRGLAIIVLAVLFIAGLIGFVIRMSAGFPNTPAWGYYAATFGFLLSTVMAAPIIPFGLHFTKAVWPRTLNRAAMLFAVPGVLWGLMFIPLLAVLPPTKGRATIWFDRPDLMPWVDSIAVAALVLLGLALLYVRSLPDLATMRDQRPGRPGGANWLAGGWRGSMRQWGVLHVTLSLLGAAYLFLYGYVTLLVTVDFDMSLIPGWRSAIYPAYHIVTSLQAALATILVTIALLRGAGGLGHYLRLDQFWSLGKMLLAFTLLWFYFFWSEFIVVWYGRMPQEQTLLQILDFGPYFVPFLLTALFAFFIPFILLIWNPIRKSVVGPPICAISVLIGLFFDRIRLYVPAYSIAGVRGAAAGEVPPTHFPDIADILIIVGAFAGMALAYLLAMRVLPVMSIWDIKVANMLSVTRRFLRTEVEVVAKPD